MLQFDVCYEAIDQNFDCGCDRCAILRLDSLRRVALAALFACTIIHGSGRFCRSSDSMYYFACKRKVKKGEAWERG